MSRKTVVAVLLATCISVAACSSSGGGKSDAPESPTSAGPGSGSLAKLVPADIKSKGTLTIGAFEQQPPDIFLDDDAKTTIGFEAELARAIANKLGLKVKFQNMQFSALITSLKSKRIDLVMSAMNDTKEREAQIDFVDYFRSGIALMVAKGNPKRITSPGDLCGHSVGVVNGTTQAAFVAKQSKTCSTAGKHAISVVSTTSSSQNRLSLQTGRLDAICNDLPSAVYAAKTTNGGKTYEVVPGEPIDAGPFGIGVNKQSTQLRTAVQKALQAVIADGEYKTILTKWGVQSGAISTATVNAAPAGT